MPAPAMPTPAPAPTPPAAGASCANPATDGPKILVQYCGLCHDPAKGAAFVTNAALDLASAGSKSRLLNIPSKLCSGKVLIQDGPKGPGGHLFEKLKGPVMGCGDRMPPFGTALTEQEVKCVKDWIRPTP
jgi:mono/diheme cytochrome c family protein